MPIRPNLRSPYRCVCAEWICQIEQECAAYGQPKEIIGIWNTASRESKVMELRFGSHKRRFFTKLECIERLRFYMLERDGPI